MGDKPPTSAERRLLSKKFGLCRGKCDSCICSEAIELFMTTNKLKVSDLLAETEADNTSLVEQEIGERVEEREDYLDIDIHRPILDSFGAVSDNEL